MCCRHVSLRRKKLGHNSAVSLSSGLGENFPDDAIRNLVVAVLCSISSAVQDQRHHQGEIPQSTTRPLIFRPQAEMAPILNSHETLDAGTAERGGRR